MPTPAEVSPTPLSPKERFIDYFKEKAQRERPQTDVAEGRLAQEIDVIKSIPDEVMELFEPFISTGNKDNFELIEKAVGAIETGDIRINHSETTTVVSTHDSPVNLDFKKMPQEFIEEALLKPEKIAIREVEGRAYIVIKN